MANKTYVQMARTLIEMMAAREISQKLPKYEETCLVTVPVEMIDRWVDVVNLAIKEEEKRDAKDKAAADDGRS